MRLLPILPYSLLKDVFIFPSRIDPINDYSGYSSSFSTFNLYWRHMLLQISDVSGFEKPAGLKKPSGLLQIQCNLKKPEGPKARPSLKNCKPGPSPRKFKPDTSLIELLKPFKPGLGKNYKFNNPLVSGILWYDIVNNKLYLENSISSTELICNF